MIHTMNILYKEIFNLALDKEFYLMLSVETETQYQSDTSPASDVGVGRYPLWRIYLSPGIKKSFCRFRFRDRPESSCFPIDFFDVRLLNNNIKIFSFISWMEWNFDE